MDSDDLKRDVPRSTELDFGDGGVHTRLNWKTGVVETVETPYVNKIDPPAEVPARTGLRFRLEHWSLGKLEALAKSRFLIADEFKEEDLEFWRTRSHKSYEAIVQSVLASSAIEGEEVFVDRAKVQGDTGSEMRDGTVDENKESRCLMGGDMYDTYIHALNYKGTPVVSLAFIQELHRRMFARVLPAAAGKLKTKPVFIVGGGYSIETAAVDRTEKLFASIVAALNQRWESGLKYAEHSLFISIAEFIVDFLAIHPFADGNGRTARLLSTYLLERAGYHFARFYSLDNVIQETKPEYYKALFSAQKGWYSSDEDLSIWIDYYIDIVHKQYRRAFEALRDVALKRARPQG